ncbi:MAG: replication initiation protein [Candidatus Acidiferrales bacterium]
MSRAVEQKNSLDGFVKPGELVEVRTGAKLSLHGRRVFNLLIENAWPEIEENKTHRIPITKLRVPLHKGGEMVADSVLTLMTTVVEVPATLDGKPAIFATQLLGPTTRTIDEGSQSALLEYKFPDDLRRIIKESHYWGRLKSHVMFAFSSKYALALYEAVCLRSNLRVNEQAFSVDDFRALLGIEPGKYDVFKNLKMRVLDPAVAEVNGLSDFTVELELLREGGQLRGKLTGFRLWWEKKSPEEWQAVLDELLRPKVGRKARIRGRVETIQLPGK